MLKPMQGGDIEQAMKAISLRSGPAQLWRLLQQAASGWVDDGAPSMGAALAFYTLLSMAPLLVLVITLSGLVVGREAAQALLFGQLHGLLGETGAQGVKSVLDAAHGEKDGLLAAGIGLAVLLLGATSVFAELKTDLDRIWDYKAPPEGSVVKFLRARLLSFGVVVAVGFLLLVSLAVSGVIAAIGKQLSEGAISAVLLQALDVGGSFIIITGLFAAIYKLLPSVDIAWADVWVGAAVTSLLFVFGKLLIGLYIGHSAVASSYGAAGTLVVVILWVYYCAQIFFLGAEFTKAWATHRAKQD